MFDANVTVDQCWAPLLDMINDWRQCWMPMLHMFNVGTNVSYDQWLTKMFDMIHVGRQCRIWSMLGTNVGYDQCLTLMLDADVVHFMLDYRTLAYILNMLYDFNLSEIIICNSKNVEKIILLLVFRRFHTYHFFKINSITNFGILISMLLNISCKIYMLLHKKV